MVARIASCVGKRSPLFMGGLRRVFAKERCHLLLVSSPMWSKLIEVIIAVIIGSVGVIAVFYGMNALANRLPNPWRSRVLPWIYVTPALLVLFGYLVIPAINTIGLSFLDRRSQNFVGLQNYLFAFTNNEMLIAFRNNILWLVFVTGISVGVGLLLAVLLDRVRYEPIVKGLIFMPMAISFVGASVIWRFMYAYRPAGDDQIGLLNAIATGLGHEPIGWTVEKCLPLVDWQPITIPIVNWEWSCWGIPALNTFALIFIMIWLQTGFCMVLLSAAVKGIPNDIIEAARIDGANEFQIFWRITIPMISSTIAVVATTVIILVLKVFDIVWVMTGGTQDTEVVASRMIKEMFNFRDFGRGSAIAVILLLAVVPVIISNIRRFQQQESIR
jgi:alpha-glucoside transport system permease protein